MLENQLSRYGAISRTIPYLAPGAKVFLVCDSDDTTVGAYNLENEFPSDKDGVSRVYTTIQAAVNAASANRGDVVLVMPNYDYTLQRADSWATAGVHIVGLGEGFNKPIIRYDSTGSEVGIGANNILVENIRFLADADSIARALDLDTGYSGHIIRNCVFDFDSNTSDFRVMIRAGAARSLIEGSRFLAEDTAGAGRAISIRGQGGDYTTIKDNYFYGQFDTVGDTTNGAAIIAIDTTDTGDTNISGLRIENNKFVSTDTASALLLRIGGGGYTARGFVVGNKFSTYDTATADTAQVDFGGLTPLDNTMITADSDVQQSVVGTKLMRGVLDSG